MRILVLEPAARDKRAGLDQRIYDGSVSVADFAIVGEIGLSGELRAVGQLQARLNEAAKLGFKRVVVPKLRRKIEGVPPALKVIEVRNVAEALSVALPRE